MEVFALNDMEKQFKNIEEFNIAWKEFEAKFKREKWRVPRCPIYKTHWPQYREISTFQFCVETFKLWDKFKKTYKKEN